MTTPRRILVAILVIHLAFFVVALIEPPKIDSDASEGMRVWRSLEAGARWNRTLDPDPKNIALDKENFLGWWSPGQYLVVGPLHSLGFSWGSAIATATFVCSLAGIMGYWWLYLRLGFSSVTSSLAAAVLSITWHITRNYGEFPGGEIPILAVSPWLVGGILALRPLKAWSPIPFAAIYIAGAMAKLSFCVTAVAALTGVCCVELFSMYSSRRLIGVAAKATSMVVLAHLSLWLIYLRHGANPSGISAHPQAWWYVFPTTFSLSVGSVLGLGSMLSRLLLFPGHAVLNSPTAMAPIFWVCSALAAALYWTLANQKGLSRDYKIYAAGMVGAFVLILAVFITIGAPISLEDRQFFPIGAILLPAVVELIRSGFSPFWRRAAAATIALSCSYGLLAIVVHARQIAATSNVGRCKFTQHIISPRALAVLHALDDKVGPGGNGTLIYVPSPEISFEIQNARVLSTFDLALSPNELKKRIRFGRVRLLVMLSNPVLEVGGRDEIIRRSFADYPPSAWKRRSVGDWTFHFQGDWPLNEAETR